MIQQCMKKKNAPLERCLGWAEDDALDCQQSSSTFQSRADEIWANAQRGLDLKREAEQNLTTKRKMQLFDQAIEKLELERESVFNETHTELAFRCRGLKRKHEETLKHVTRNLEAQRENIENMFQYELNCIEECKRACIEKLKERMIQELSTKVKALENRRDGVVSDERINTRSLRSKMKSNDANDEHTDSMDSIAASGLHSGTSQITPSSRRRNKVISVPGFMIDQFLDDAEAQQDLYDITRNVEPTRENLPGNLKEAQNQVSVKAGQLRFQGSIFSKNDAVVAWTASGDRHGLESAPGTIQMINGTEVHVKLHDHHKNVRLSIANLRSGKARIAHAQKAWQ